jgi:branched-chain amino acid transport system ATP-binding protein
MLALEGKGLTGRFGGFIALDGVDIAVAQGEIRALIGPNGAGKSTLIDVLSGRARDWNGEVRLFDIAISKLSIQERRSLGLARSFQRTNIFSDLTVIEQLRLAARTTENENSEEVMEALALSQYAHRRAGDISYGDQRRLDLALALVGRPKVLLLDEPAAGLSLGESLALAKLLKELVGRWGVTVLLVEHDMEVVFSICDRITVLHLGRILAEGAPNDIRRVPEVVTAYLGTGMS